MEIDNNQRPSAYGLANSQETPKRPDQSFASMLDADRLRAQNEAAKGAILAGQKDQPKNDNAEDIDFIREKGVRAFTEEVHQRKQQEIREKILKTMGLTEQMLDDMTAGQRQAIEDMIAREIEQRLAAESMANDGSKNENGSDQSAAIGNIRPDNILAAQILIGDSGALIGLLANDRAAQEEQDPTLSRNRKDAPGIG